MSDKKRDRDIKKLKTFGELIVSNLDAMTRTACPDCGCYTLAVTVSARSGVQFSCEGFSRYSEGGECGFREYVFVTAYSELPEMRPEDSKE